MSRLNVGNLFNENEDGAPVVSGISTFSSPNYFIPPSGSTAERPQNPGEGMIRFNTDSGHLEYYTGELWVDVIVNNQDLGDQNNSNSTGGTGNRGLFIGGFSPSPLNAVHNVIQYVTISTLGNAQDFGDLASTAAAPGSVASRTRGIRAGGAPDNTIEFVTISSTGNAADFGDLIQSTRDQGAAGNETRGIFAGGQGPVDVIQFITIAQTGNSVDFGNLSSTRDDLTRSQVNSAVRGVFAGGYASSPTTVAFNIIEYVTISTTGDAQDFGDLTVARHRTGGACNSTRGIFNAGATQPSGASNVIDFITIASTGNALDFGDSTLVNYRSMGGCSSQTRGVFGGGLTLDGPTLVYQNVIEFITIATTGNAADFGDLIFPNTFGSALSNGHGGL